MQSDDQLSEIAGQFDVLGDIKPLQTGFDENQTRRERDWKGDESLFVKFKYKPRWGKAIKRHVNELVVEIHKPGIAREVTTLPVNEEHKLRFARQWKAFEAGEEAREEGVPLETLPYISAAMRADLQAMKVYTAEQLAAIPDSALGMLGPGGRTIRTKTEAYLDSMKGGTLIDKVVDENRNLQMQIAQKEEALAELMQRVQKLESGAALEEKVAALEKSKPVARKEKTDS